MIRDRRMGYRGPEDRHGLCPREDNALYVIARKERQRGRRESIVSRGTRSEYAVRDL